MLHHQFQFNLSLAFCFFVTTLHAQPVCGGCHPRETATYNRTAMANSLGVPEEQPGAQVVHKLSGATVTIRSEHGAMVQAIEEKGLKAEYKVPYYVGAGKVGRSYFARAGDYLLQSPVSFYTKANGWDLTPDYSSKRSLDFDHVISSGCLFCHTGEVRLIGGTQNRFERVPFTPISCERCHGPSAEHVKSPSRTNIVNPAMLPVRARDGVCEQCHLEDAVRILNPGKDWWDFRAGQEMEQTFAVYLQKNANGVKAVSHVEQLAESACFRASGGRMWCATCHDPHADSTGDRKSQMKQICQSCHAQLSAASHAAVTECTSCHMPPRSASDVAHAAITDHRILRKPEPERDTQKSPLEPPVPWKQPEPELLQRDQAIADLTIASDLLSAPLETEAVRLFLDLRGPLADDPVVLAALGSVMLQQNMPKEALKYFTEAVRQDPRNAENVMDLGLAYAQAGDMGQAMRNLEHAIQLDPSLRRAYFELARLHAALGQEGARMQVLHRYLTLFPESIEGRHMLLPLR